MKRNGEEVENNPQFAREASVWAHCVGEQCTVQSHKKAPIHFLCYDADNLTQNFQSKAGMY